MEFIEGLRDLIPGRSGKEVTFYPTYAYLQDDEWVIELRAWVHQTRTLVNWVATALADLIHDYDDERRGFFKARSSVFEYDDKYNENLIIEFDDDPEKIQYSGNAPSNQNGIVEFSLTLPRANAW
jgi:hypothetical protein